MGVRANHVGVLDAAAPCRAHLGALAERRVVDDALAVPIRLCPFGACMIRDVAARHSLLPSASACFDDVLRALPSMAVLDRVAP